MDSMVQANIATLQELIRQTPEGGMVFFGGAGVSTESGIPDFRSRDGLYSMKFKYPPETMLSRSFFDTHPKDFYDFYFDRVVALDAKPNRAHIKLAELEAEGILYAVVTQNIDGLHQAAGSRSVYELHESILRNNCMHCGANATIEEMVGLHDASLAEGADGIPRCPGCGGIMKPDVVLYEEPLDMDVMQGAIDSIARADLMLVAGTSLAVNPAAGLIQYFRGSHLVIVNKSTTPYDDIADLVIPASIGDALDF